MCDVDDVVSGLFPWEPLTLLDPTHHRFSPSNRAPFIIKPAKSAPVLAAGGNQAMAAGGKQSDVLAEFVDIMPTLMDLAGLPVPPGQQRGSGRMTAHPYPQGRLLVSAYLVASLLACFWFASMLACLAF